MSEKYIKAADCEKYFYEHLDDAHIAGAMNAIDEMPAADVVPVRHGHFRRLTFSGDIIICSECKMAYNIFETNGAENFDYCPNCGAKMGGKERDEND